MTSLVLLQWKWAATLVLLAAVLAPVRPVDAPARHVRPYPAEPIPASFMGLSVGDYVHLHPSMQFGTARSWDGGGWSAPVGWSHLETASGKFDWANLETYIHFLRSRGVEGIYTFGGTPSWAAERSCMPPARMEDWDAWVRAVVTQSVGRIRYWELWNEPQDTKYYCGSVEQLVTMAQHAQAIIKAIEPEGRLLGPAVTSETGPAWLQRFLSLGGGKYLDIVSFHGYSWNDDGVAEDIVPILHMYEAILQRAGLSKLPLWDTEASWAGRGFASLTSQQQAAFVPKAYILRWSGGVTRFVWYQYDGGVFGGLWKDGVERPAAGAFQQTYQWLVGARLASACSENPVTHVWTCALRRPDGYRAELMWDSTGSQPYAVPKAYTISCDLSGKTRPVPPDRMLQIGNDPILLENRQLPASPNPNAEAQ